MSSESIPPVDIPALLKEYGLSPSKSLGQNFLKDRKALQKIVAAAHLEPIDKVLEIGPGLGNLTRYLALSASAVTAVELDKDLFPVLKVILAPYTNVRSVQGDILKLDPADLMGSQSYVVVANIPYYITSAVIRHLLESDPKPRQIVMTIQKEVAERICAKDGKMSLLALSVQVYGKPEIVAEIPAEAFYPVPKVDSAIIRIEIYPEPVIAITSLDKFFALIKAGFSQKRKTLRNSISAGLRMKPQEVEELLNSAGIDPRRRAETINLVEWRNLVYKLRQ
jgi:16S rRNA (adenine1518-N6/adenine1519-N6)-dimethyltransferase